jgi:hypothetical protein
MLWLCCDNNINAAYYIHGACAWNSACVEQGFSVSPEALSIKQYTAPLTFPKLEY